MARRKPLVRIGGKLKQLPTGDTLPVDSLPVGAAANTVAAGDDARLSDNREWAAPTATEAQAAASLGDTRLAWTTTRLGQLWTACWGRASSVFGRTWAAIANAAAGRAALELGSMATQEGNDVRITGGIAAAKNIIGVISSTGLASSLLLHHRINNASTSRMFVLSMPIRYAMMRIDFETYDYSSPGRIATGTFTGYWNGTIWSRFYVTHSGADRISVMIGITSNGDPSIVFNADAKSYAYPSLSIRATVGHGAYSPAELASWALADAATVDYELTEVGPNQYGQTYYLGYPGQHSVRALLAISHRSGANGVYSSLTLPSAAAATHTLQVLVKSGSKVAIHTISGTWNGSAWGSMSTTVQTAEAGMVFSAVSPTGSPAILISATGAAAHSTVILTAHASLLSQEWSSASILAADLATYSSVTEVPASLPGSILWATNAAPKIWASNNTTVDGNGFIKQASPVIHLRDSGIEVFGFAEESPVFKKLGVGEYLIEGTSGLAGAGWYIETPCDRNGNKYYNVDWFQDCAPDAPDGTVETPQNVSLRVCAYERVWNPAAGKYENGAPVDIDERPICLRFNEVVKLAAPSAPEMLDGDGGDVRPADGDIQDEG